ncbi:vegetative cell wall protein gp1-like [Portunus trituberculatus]|uniref:vegetative cell wall protein gp1-like n=1 Tax=Portunus trituberculatus TaxID=210409 RepID=UPI001E1D0359|nr:vegetative cell wall protein gp1-like [Portunus trituberculatus]
MSRLPVARRRKLACVPLKRNQRYRDLTLVSLTDESPPPSSLTPLARHPVSTTPSKPYPPNHTLLATPFQPPSFPPPRLRHTPATCSQHHSHPDPATPPHLSPATIIPVTLVPATPSPPHCSQHHSHPDPATPPHSSPATSSPATPPQPASSPPRLPTQVKGNIHGETSVGVKWEGKRRFEDWRESFQNRIYVPRGGFPGQLNSCQLEAT